MAIPEVLVEGRKYAITIAMSAGKKAYYPLVWFAGFRRDEDGEQLIFKDPDDSRIYTAAAGLTVEEYKGGRSVAELWDGFLDKALNVIIAFGIFAFLIMIGIVIVVISIGIYRAFQ
jgi:hypothetical protein